MKVTVMVHSSCGVSRAILRRGCGESSVHGLRQHDHELSEVLEGANARKLGRCQMLDEPFAVDISPM